MTSPTHGDYALHVRRQRTIGVRWWVTHVAGAEDLVPRARARFALSTETAKLRAAELIERACDPQDDVLTWPGDVVVRHAAARGLADSHI